MTEWAISQRPVSYPDAVAAMEARVEAILRGEADELVWLLEHPPLYTAGASAKRADLIDPDRLPVFETARGGQFTYHGPGQRIAYVMLDLSRQTHGRGRDIRNFVCNLEGWLIDALAEFNLKGERRPGRVGVWIDRTRPGERRAGTIREDKIAAIGVRLRRWVSFHGVSLNIDPDLSHFAGITPCGIREPGLGVTSLEDLGRIIPMHEADVVLKRTFIPRFGDVVAAEAPV